MTEAYRNRIISLNRRLGLKTEFFNDEEICGYAVNDTIYLNENEDDLFRVNLHEILHFYEDNEAFLRYKDMLLDRMELLLPKLREKYLLKYAGMYTEDEINSGIIDTEIIIDILVDEYSSNYEVDLDSNLRLGNMVLGAIKKNLDSKRFLTLSVRNNIKGMHLSKWEKIFAENYYRSRDVFGEKHDFPSINKYERIKYNISKSLEDLYNMKPEDFAIDPNCCEVLRYYNSTVNALINRGEDANRLVENKDLYLQDIARRFSKQLYDEYRHTVSLIKNSDYEDAFKYLMLNETLTKAYKRDDGNKTIIKRRDLHSTLNGLMIFNHGILDTIYNHGEETSFPNLYFAALEINSKKVADASHIRIDNVDTYGKGRWIKFEGKSNNDEEYIKNAINLSSLISNTQWCTRTEASKSLADGDFYVFIDNDNKPRIAVKMTGNSIDEVRGNRNGSHQELEEEYRDVAVSFLKNNTNIENGREWLEKEEWNKRLVSYKKDILDNNIDNIDVDQLMLDLKKIDYKAHASSNSMLEELWRALEESPSMINRIREHYNVKEDEFVMTLDESTPNKENIKMCFNANLHRFKELEELPNLEVIIHRGDFRKSEIKSIPNLREVGESLLFDDSLIEDLHSLKTVGGSLDLRETDIRDLSSLEQVGKDLDLSTTFELDSVPNLKCVGRDADFEKSRIKSLPGLEEIRGDANFNSTEIKHLDSIKKIWGNAEFKYSDIESIDNLSFIGGDANFYASNIKSLPELKLVKWSLYLGRTEIEEIPKLEEVSKVLECKGSKIRRLPNLRRISEGYFANSNLESLPMLEATDYLFLNIDNTPMQRNFYEGSKKKV